MNPNQQIAFDKFMNEQFTTLKGHHERTMLRIFNKYMELQERSRKEDEDNIVKRAEKIKANHANLGILRREKA